MFSNNGWVVPHELFKNDNKMKSKAELIKKHLGAATPAWVMKNCLAMLKEYEDMFIDNVFSSEDYKIYTPKDDPDVVVMEGPFGRTRTFDLKDFDNLMDAINSVKDY